MVAHNTDLPPEYQVFSVWHDPIVDRHGYPARSDYVEHFWLPAIGPTALLVLRRVVEHLADNDYEDTCIDLTAMASCMGLSNRRSSNSPFRRSLDRLGRFGLSYPTNQALCVRTILPTVPQRLTKLWPAELHRLHDEYLEHTLT